eukprot:CAMPEP_0118954362 /NCGR_PEP_ID=MMETSP1169-20130426/58126_1 /TAXON_ID=36882 /ORGANISM="Pyramimonas obovata, Strain CCMP722" /LENGTH=35 /DNA_ID= /DNA_START= /DNA_END= /DNA_ORIENTATION=
MTAEDKAAFLEQNEAEEEAGSLEGGSQGCLRFLVG